MSRPISWRKSTSKCVLYNAWNVYSEYQDLSWNKGWPLNLGLCCWWESYQNHISFSQGRLNKTWDPVLIIFFSNLCSICLDFSLIIHYCLYNGPWLLKENEWKNKGPCALAPRAHPLSRAWFQRTNIHNLLWWWWTLFAGLWKMVLRAETCC